MNLAQVEIDYLRRFEFETWYNMYGPGSVYAECQEKSPGSTSFLSDLADLATPSVQYQVMQDLLVNPDDLADNTKHLYKYPKVPFPWASLEALHQRVLELDPLSQPHERDIS